MRITKKFTGSACLGKRMYSSSERPLVAQSEMAAAATHLKRLEARFWHHLERSKDRDYIGFLELDAGVYGHCNIISTPAIDALLQQSRNDPHFWDDDWATQAEADADSASDTGGDDDLDMPQLPPHFLAAQQASSSSSYTTTSSYSSTSSSSSSCRSLKRKGDERVEEDVPAPLQRFSSSTSSSSRSSDSSTYTDVSSDSSSCGHHESNKRGRHSGREEWSEESCLSDQEYGYYGLAVKEEEEEEAESDMSITSGEGSSCFSHHQSYQHSEADDQEHEEDAGVLLNVVCNLRKSGSHDDLVDFVDEVNQKLFSRGLSSTALQHLQ